MNRVYELDIYCNPRGNDHKRTLMLLLHGIIDCIDFD